MILIAIVCEMWSNRVNENELSLDILHQQEWINIAVLCNQVIFFQVGQFEEAMLKSLLESHFIVVVSSLFNGIVKFIIEDLIP